MKQKLTIIFFFFTISNFLSAQNMDYSGSRGEYLSKKTYTDSGIPDYSKSKKLLPVPIVTDNPEYIELYWKTWELAFLRFKKPPAGSPLVSNFMDEAFAPQIFQWDTIFMLEFARYGFHIFPVIQSLDNFYCRQHDDGFIHRELREGNGNEFWFEGFLHAVNPPLFAWAEVEQGKLSGDHSRFEMVFPVLVKYAEWLESNRKIGNTVHQLYWNTGLGSGMDNTPRKGSGWVDMSAQMVIMYHSLASIAHDLKKQSEENWFNQKADSIAFRINKFMWNETDGVYYDVDDAGVQQKHMTIASFWPLLAKISSKSQVEKMMNQLRNPETFWRTNVFPSLAANHPDYQPDGKYWLGSVWAPTNVATIKGLDNYPEVYNSTEFATQATKKYLDNMVKVYKETGTIWENYSSEIVSRGSWSKPDFIGWSGCGPVQLLIENIIGIRPDAVANKVEWFLQRIDRHGIANLTFGKNKITLIAEKRKSVVSPIIISVDSEKEFDLVLHKGETAKVISIKKGKQKITFE